MPKLRSLVGLSQEKSHSAPILMRSRSLSHSIGQYPRELLKLGKGQLVCKSESQARVLKHMVEVQFVKSIARSVDLQH